MAAIELADLPKSTLGKRNNPGMSSEMFLLPVSELLAIPAPPTYVNPGDSLKIDGPITVVTPASMGFRKIYTTARSTQMLMELVGQPDSKAIDFKFEFERPGFDAGFLEMLLQDGDYVLAVRVADCKEQLMYIIGEPCNPVKVEGNYASGKMGETDGKNGWTGTVTYNGVDIRILDAETDPLPLLPTP